jgi:EAL domain-containing protein (putative c-di-GMP-specific phosphodiesterase class I)
VIGVEALLRWRRPRHGLVPPGQFIPLAEQGGLIKPLTRWVLGEALNQCRTWEHAGRPMPVAVNLSARDLQDPHLVSGLSELLAARGLPPQRLQLELTESAMMADPAHAADVLCALDARGVRLSIDDFGTGYSSLAYLGKLPVSELKIDRSFVMGMATHGSKDTTIVRSTAQLGHHLGLKVVAEGVENGDVLERLHNLGCDAAQGYYIAHPMSADDLGGWLAQSRWCAAAN